MYSEEDDLNHNYGNNSNRSNLQEEGSTTDQHEYKHSQDQDLYKRSSDSESGDKIDYFHLRNEDNRPSRAGSARNGTDKSIRRKINTELGSFSQETSLDQTITDHLGDGHSIMTSREDYSIPRDSAEADNFFLPPINNKTNHSPKEKKKFQEVDSSPKSDRFPHRESSSFGNSPVSPQSVTLPDINSSGKSSARSPLEKGELDSKEKETEKKSPDSGKGFRRRSSELEEVAEKHESDEAEKHEGGEAKKHDDYKALVNYTDHPLLEHVNNHVIGKDSVIKTPFGLMKVYYCDYTASGKCLSFIEDYIRCHVYPSYANTHSSTGHNARQTGKFREEARQMIKDCVNCNKDDNLVFTGSGATSAMHKVAWALKINLQRVAKDSVVFIGPYEHHSNILPWREYGTHVVRIHHDHHTGMVDLTHLDTELKFWKEKRSNLVVCMSAASNVSGIITDTDAVSTIAHKHGALAIFDYAAGGPYLKIDMNSGKSSYKDAVIISPHKFVGGPGTPGVLIAKKWIFKNSVPERVGGGTVSFVTRETHAYVGNIEEKEEGGTPEIIGAIRAGMIFQLKKDIGEEIIEKREDDLCHRAFHVWEQNPNMVILGSHVAKRIPIFSFVTKHAETGKFVHHNFISTLLSDLFGIQARGGCACAGPYAEDLLGITEVQAKRFTWFLSDSPNGKSTYVPSQPMNIMKPGFTRLNLAYFFHDETVDFVIEAVDMVTRHGWKLLPQYTFDIHAGSWIHKSLLDNTDHDLVSLADIEFLDLIHSDISNLQQAIRHNYTHTFKDILDNARKLFDSVYKTTERSHLKSASLRLKESLPKDKRALKWFMTPHEAALAITEASANEKNAARMPFRVLSPAHRHNNKGHKGLNSSQNQSQHSKLQRDLSIEKSAILQKDRFPKPMQRQYPNRAERQNNTDTSSSGDVQISPKSRQVPTQPRRFLERRQPANKNFQQSKSRVDNSQRPNQSHVQKSHTDMTTGNDDVTIKEEVDGIQEVPMEMSTSYLAQHKRQQSLKKTQSLPYKKSVK